MLAALDFTLSVRWILRWIFDRHSRQIQSDDFEPASSAPPQWLESVPSMRHTRGQDVSPPNPFHAMPEDFKNSLGHGLQPARASSPCPC
jgi:hypothetical protein